MKDNQANEKEERENRFSRKREKTRRELLAAARRVFANKSLSEATIKEIADEADIGFGTFYLHFTSKEDVFNEVIRQGLQDLRQVVEENNNDATEDSFWVRQHSAVLTYLKFAYANRDLFGMIFWGQNEGIGEVRRLREDLRERIAERLEKLIAAGLIQWSEPKLLAGILIGILTQAALWWIDHDTPTPEEMANQISSFVLRGMVGQLPSELANLNL